MCHFAIDTTYGKIETRGWEPWYPTQAKHGLNGAPSICCRDTVRPLCRPKASLCRSSTSPTNELGGWEPWYPTQAKTRLDPDFLYAAPGNGDVCGFH
jgi:hypothetical protein